MTAGRRFYQYLGLLLILGVVTAGNVLWNRSNTRGGPDAFVQAAFMVLALGSCYQMVVSRQFLAQHRRLRLGTAIFGAGAVCGAGALQVAGGGVANVLLSVGAMVAFAGAAVLVFWKAKPGAAS